MVTITLGTMTTNAKQIGPVGATALVAMREVQRRRLPDDDMVTAGQRRALEALAQRAAISASGVDIAYIPVGSGKVIICAIGTAARL